MSAPTMVIGRPGMKNTHDTIHATTNTTGAQMPKPLNHTSRRSTLSIVSMSKTP